MDIKKWIAVFFFLMIGCDKSAHFHTNSGDIKTQESALIHVFSEQELIKDYGLLYCLSGHLPDLDKTQELTIAYEEYKKIPISQQKYYKNIEIFFEDRMPDSISTYHASELENKPIKAVFVECMHIYNSKEYKVFLHKLMTHP